MRVRSRSGFTLIELLIVVAVIGLLVTVLAAVLLGAFGKGKEAEARNFMDNIIPQAIQKWADANGKPNRCPPSGTNPADPIEGNSKLYKELVANPREAGNTAYLDMTGVSEGKEGGNTVFLDPWGTPYMYRDWSAPPPKGSKGGDTGIGGVKPYNPGSFDMISAGQDKKFGTEDDIIRGGHTPVPEKDGKALKR